MSDIVLEPQFQPGGDNFTGYRIDLENTKWLKEFATEATVLMMGDTPERVDPRTHQLFQQGYLQVENQGQIGSCQGNALTECGEFCFSLLTGLVIQFSRMFAYIVSQMESNIRGDSGSTLEGGTKAVLDYGYCPETLAPYPSGYPGWGYVTAAMKAEAKKYLLKSHTTIKSAEHLRQYIGSGIGIVQIGIAWGGAMTPDSNGCIRSFRAGMGGHSVVFAGYVPDSDVGQKSSAGWWGLLKNSWGKNWGKKGYAYIDPQAIDQMINHSWSSFYGRSDMEAPNPRPIPVDFTKKSVIG